MEVVTISISVNQVLSRGTHPLVERLDSSLQEEPGVFVEERRLELRRTIDSFLLLYLNVVQILKFFFQKNCYDATS